MPAKVDTCISVLDDGRKGQEKQVVIWKEKGRELEDKSGMELIILAYLQSSDFADHFCDGCVEQGTHSFAV